MISCLIGLPGSGKSTLLSFLAYRAIMHKSINFHGFHVQTTHYDHVFTNFPANGAYKFDFDKLGYVDYRDCCLLCDEIQLFADSRNFKEFGDNLKFWFSNHRKFRTDFKTPRINVIYTISKRTYSFVDGIEALSGVNKICPEFAVVREPEFQIITKFFEVT